MTNPITQIDFYKADHRSQYPKGTNLVFSNLTPRGSRITDVNKMIFFGLQYFIKKYLIEDWNENFFNRPKTEVINKYKRRMNTSLGKDAITYEHMEALHDLGYLPIDIYALPEGTAVPMRVPTLIYFNTVDSFFWLTNYLESILSCIVWGSCTSATTSNEYRKILNEYADLTVGNRDFVSFQGHDFSFRGMFGLEASQLSGAGHLLSFVGTDTVSAIDFLEDYYNADCEQELIGCSVPATEHSVMCMGMEDGEIETIKRLINDLYPSGIISIVSDTWDFWKVICDYLSQLKNDILKRDGKVVIRPDSGDPVKIICGWNVVSEETFRCNDIEFNFEDNYDEDELTEIKEIINHDIYDTVYFKDGKYYKLYYMSLYEECYKFYLGDEVPKYEVSGAIDCMWEVFGGTITKKGYKLLDSHIGLIYGDSITIERAKEICSRLESKGFASTNVILGDWKLYISICNKRYIWNGS
jgi:nicotinamide phosphoribosyltransferase